ncbi:hypothetical protein D3C84_1127260 [compost metagenome]
MRIRRGARQAADFLDAGLDQILATDRATVGQLQRKRHIRAWQITGKQAWAPQLRAVDGKTEYSHLAAPYPTSIGQGFAPISQQSWALEHQNKTDNVADKAVCLHNV